MTTSSVRSCAARKGLRVPGALDPFELGVRAILGQQVSVGRATALVGRARRAGGQARAAASHRSGLTHEFPSAGGRGRRRPLDPRAHQRAGAARSRDSRPRCAGGESCSTARPASTRRFVRCASCPGSVRGPPTTSPCVRAGSATRFPRRISRSARSWGRSRAADRRAVATLARLRGDAPVGRATAL